MPHTPAACPLFYVLIFQSWSYHVCAFVVWASLIKNLFGLCKYLFSSLTYINYVHYNSILCSLDE